MTCRGANQRDGETQGRLRAHLARPCVLCEEQQGSAPSRDELLPRLTYLESLVVLDSIHTEASADADDLLGPPISSKARPSRNRLKLVLDGASARVRPETGGERARDVQGEGEQVSTSFESVRVSVLVHRMRCRRGGRVEEGEVVKEERMIVVVSRRVAPGHLGSVMYQTSKSATVLLGRKRVFRERK